MLQVSSHAKPTEVKFQVPMGPCSLLCTSSQAPWYVMCNHWTVCWSSVMLKPQLCHS